MTAQRLLALYDRVAEAPDAVVRLRRFVLDLAVRGKLVEQDPADELASELLERIAAEKARLVHEGKFKRFEGTLDRDPESFPFSIPTNWTWCYLDDIAAVARGGSPRPIRSFLTTDPTGIPWIKIGDSSRGSIYIDETRERIKPQGLPKSRLVTPGDLLLSNSMSFGFPYITNIEGCIHDGWLVIRTPEGLLDKLFLHKVLLSDHARIAFSHAASGAVVQNLNADKARQLTIPLPPLAEQHRIVARVDELMALCDRLEETRTAREETRDRLTKASLARLSASDAGEGAFQAHARFTVDALPALTARTDQVIHLRQTILNLAVEGKLAKQDPSDEPAETLLQRIALEKTRRTTKTRSKSVLLNESDLTSEIPFTLPKGWALSTIGKICSKTGSGSTPRGGKTAYTANGVIFLRSQNIHNDGLRLADVVYIDESTHERMSGTKVRALDLLLNITGGSIGRCCIVPDKLGQANVSQHVSIIRPAIDDLHRFLHVLIMAPYFQAFIFDEQTGAGRGGLPKRNMDKIPIALPPIAEQHRIVTKVDELMTQCDELESALDNAESTRNNLLQAILGDSLASMDGG